ncbi:MAG: Protein phosphatase 1F, partial [Paramarteilia canceri]
IEKKGGKIVKSGSGTDGKNILRLNGQLAVGRSIGDIFHKPYMISKASASEWVDLNANEFQYLILVCDGVMDVIEPEELPAILKSAQKPTDCFNLAEYIVEEARTRKSDDNLTAIVVDIPQLLQQRG